MPKAYLCGSIQDARDGGVKWRDKLKPKLEELGIKVLDPCKSEANLTDGTVNDAKEMMAGWVAAGHWDKFLDHMRRVRNSDIEMVRESDMLIVFLDWRQKFGGTIAEMHEAFYRHIPLYVVCYDPVSDWNHWVLSMVKDGGQIFENWAQLVEFIEKKYGKK